MELKEKLEILIKRNGYKKSDFAAALGITYRALANYISGSRYPREKSINDMAALLGVSADLLTDNNVSLDLSSDEKLYFKGSSDRTVLDEADGLLTELDRLFKSEAFDEKDKTAFYNCISEKYFFQKAKSLK